jgi:PIN domain nuclease of toxin-antitoxin system
MDLLLDTHTLRWFFSGAPQLSETAKQGIIEKMSVVTVDPNIKLYPVKTIW